MEKLRKNVVQYFISVALLVVLRTFLLMPNNKANMFTDSDVVSITAAPHTYNQQTLTFDPVYLHVSSSTHSCQLAATRVAGRAAETQTGSDTASVAP